MLDVSVERVDLHVPRVNEALDRVREPIARKASFVYDAVDAPLKTPFNRGDGIALLLWRHASSCSASYSRSNPS